MNNKVILDADVIADFYKDNRTGIFRVTFELFKKLSENKDIKTFYSHLAFFNGETSVQELDDFFINNHVEIQAVNNRKRRTFLPFRKEKLFKYLYKQIGIYNYRNIHYKMLFEEAGIFHSFYYPIHNDVKKYSHLKKVITIHDLIPILFPDLHFTAELIKEIVKSIGTDGFAVCVSESTKKDLLAYAPYLNPDHVFVNHLAASKELFYVCRNKKKLTNITNKYNLPDKYFLSLGTLEPRKNIDHVIRTFLKLIRENEISDMSLVLVGAKGWNFDKIFNEYESAEELKDKIVFIGKIPDEDLASLYSNAHSFYYMSLYEGFGLPPLEAMQCGVPTVTSNTSSLPEVVENGGIMLDPHDEKALYETMLRLYQDESFRMYYSEKGLEQSEKFSWQLSAERQVEIYKKILEIR
ncbi:glycosyltransferase involved in cell wall biosynthesis [Chryseobacterium sp. SORGH_AS 447]|uniref:glycosyltransferase family 4 protein n=1 Tax=Chryseobacterium sp. SORGH_AS_0447 TaxID=3041769 RepID=UPI00278974DD|nr:glycosyltransferase family 1 protein [Chryseobacterium sp. SORGH_AS_0447]MDQ1160524.1 glycosyltransferase involved in cell wall biosynthesis [Chryseobacterium sp. SORGH_AS_0447]